MFTEIIIKYTMLSNNMLKKYLLEQLSDSNNEDLLEATKNMNEDVEGDSQLKSQVEVCKRKKQRQRI